MYLLLLDTMLLDNIYLPLLIVRVSRTLAAETSLR